MMARLLITAMLTTILLVGLGPLSADVPQQEPSTDGPKTDAEAPAPQDVRSATINHSSSHRDQPTHRLSEAEIKELDAIRRQLGVSPLRDSVFSETHQANSRFDQSDFANQLRAHFGHPRQGDMTHGRQRPGTQLSESELGQLYRRLRLRSLSRRLDAISQDLEDLEQFEEADQVRRLSLQLRKQARP